jgi:hypothetical protein
MKYIIGILCILLLIAGIFIINNSLTIDNLKTELEYYQTELAICQNNAATADTIKHETVKLDLDGRLTIKPNTIYLDRNLDDSVYMNWFYRHSLNDKPKSTNMLYNYTTKKVAYEIELTDMDATVYIPQHRVALDTYRWYREVKGYSVRKSIQLTEKHWTLNLVN